MRTLQVMAARSHHRLIYLEAVEREDIPEWRSRSAFLAASVEEALGNVLARKDDQTRKRGALTGAFSTRFPTSPRDERQTGRIVYLLQGNLIIVLAMHHDHDEAYRRARRRVRAAQDR